MLKAKCPYCKNIYKVEIISDNCCSYDVICEECNNTFEVTISFTPKISAKKIKYIKCTQCNENKRFYDNGMLPSYCYDCFIKWYIKKTSK